MKKSKIKFFPSESQFDIGALLSFIFIAICFALLIAGLNGCSNNSSKGDSSDDDTDTVFDSDSNSDTDSDADSLSYPIIETMQSNCYDSISKITCGTSFTGQDAEYKSIPASYTDNGDGTITDNNTGLMWQQDPGDAMSLDAAISGADSFNLAGYDDWRLPTIKELYSLMDFRGEDVSICMTGDCDENLPVPFIDTNYFSYFEYGSDGPRMIDSQYVSSTLYVGDNTIDDQLVFGLNLADGRIKGYGTELMGQPKLFMCMYVRGNSSYGINDFLDNKDGTITDNATGLTWMQNDNGEGVLWEDAMKYCEDLTFADKSDWRLPDAKELQSIVDYTRAPSATNSPAIDPVFNSTEIIDENGYKNWGYYFTGTTHKSYNSDGESIGGWAVYVAFGESLGNINGDGIWYDVHGAGCQRSDPKGGDPAEYADGHGPQGDSVRIYNLARCVRGGI